MFSINKVFLKGNLGGDPVKETNRNGKDYARFQLATNKPWKSPEGQEEEPDWHTIFVWGRQADSVIRHLKKGSGVFVEGHLSVYKSSEGDEQRRVSISADSVTFLG